MLEIAFGELGLSADEFGWMTPFEFYQRRRGYIEKENNLLRKLGILIAELYNSSGFVSKRVTPRDVFPDLFEVAPRAIYIPSVEEEKAQIEAILKRERDRNGSN